jgi:hypothetical protein
MIAAVPIWLCWWWMSRIPSIRWTITLLLFGVYAGGIVVTQFWRVSRFTAVPLTMLMLVATVVTGWALERRRLGPGSARRQTLPLYVLAGWLLTVACSIVVVLNLPDPYE